MPEAVQKVSRQCESARARVMCAFTISASRIGPPMNAVRSNCRNRPSCGVIGYHEGEMTHLPSIFLLGPLLTCLVPTIATAQALPVPRFIVELPPEAVSRQRQGTWFCPLRPSLGLTRAWAGLRARASTIALWQGGTLGPRVAMILNWRFEPLRWFRQHSAATAPSSVEIRSESRPTAPH
jgi:hypothetical protein